MIELNTTPDHVRAVESGPGHLDLGNGAYAVDVNLDLDTRDDGPFSSTVAELHLGLANHDPEVGEDIADVAAVAIELNLADVDNLIERLTALRASVAARAAGLLPVESI